MIGRVTGAPSKSLGDLELKNSDPQKNKTKRADPGRADSKSDGESDDAPASNGPIHIRFLGRNLDIIA